MQIKKGNYTILEIGIKDENNKYITDLSTATEIYYMIKENQADTNIDALVTKTKTDGGIIIDTPSTGFCRIILNAGDTENIEPGFKYHGFQIKYSNDDIKEIWIKSENSNVFDDRIEILQDIIRKE